MAKQKKETKLNPNWQQTPEWVEQVKKVKSLQEKGYDEKFIATVTDYPAIEIKRICEDENIAKARAKENYVQKIPIMKEIIGMGLEGIREFLKELILDSDKRREAIKTVAQANTLKSLITDLEMLVRLEEGKTTANIAVAHGEANSYQKTREAIQELKKVDKVFDYPELPEPVRKTDEV